MRWFRGMAMVLVGIMLLTIFGSAFAAVKDDTVSPLYLYTRKVTSTKKNVFRTYCDGKYTSGEYFYKTLYKKSGSSWTKVTGWTDSHSGHILEIEKTRQVSEGTYKVVVTGTVTNSEGKKEEVKTTSTEMTYSKK